MSIYTKNQNNNDNMSTSRHEHKKKTKKKKPKKKFIIMMFIIYEFVFMSCTFPFILLYGPFENAKKKFVGSAMTSMHFQCLAKWFLSDDEIKFIIGDNSEETETDTTDIKSIDVSAANDDTIKSYTIDGNARYKGYYIVVNNPKRVKVGISSKLEVEGETTSEIAEHYGAVAAINGGSFVDKTSVKWTGTGAYPDGLVISGGGVIWDSTSNGGNTELFGITQEGVLIVGRYSKDELKELNVQEALSFRPVLIVNGKKSAINVDGGFAPRTAIGQRKDGAIILLVLDSKVISRFGATYTEVQEIMYKLGAMNAINLDGGRSTTMYYDGEIINSPENSMGERTIPTAVIVQ